MNDDYQGKVEDAKDETQCNECIHEGICFYMLAENKECHQLNYSLICKFYQEA